LKKTFTPILGLFLISEIVVLFRPRDLLLSYTCVLTFLAVISVAAVHLVDINPFQPISRFFKILAYTSLMLILLAAFNWLLFFHYFHYYR